MTDPADRPLAAAAELETAVATAAYEAAARAGQAVHAEWQERWDVLYFEHREAKARAEVAEARIVELEEELLSARRTGFDEHEKTRTRTLAAEKRVAELEADKRQRQLGTDTIISASEALEARAEAAEAQVARVRSLVPEVTKAVIAITEAVGRTPATDALVTLAAQMERALDGAP